MNKRIQKPEKTTKKHPINIDESSVSSNRKKLIVSANGRRVYRKGDIVATSPFLVANTRAK